jgi:hypothetical protein
MKVNPGNELAARSNWSAKAQPERSPQKRRKHSLNRHFATDCEGDRPQAGYHFDPQRLDQRTGNDHQQIREFPRFFPNHRYGTVERQGLPGASSKELMLRNHLYKRGPR